MARRPHRQISLKSLKSTVTFLLLPYPWSPTDKETDIFTAWSCFRIDGEYRRWVLGGKQTILVLGFINWGRKLKLGRLRVYGRNLQKIINNGEIKIRVQKIWGLGGKKGSDGVFFKENIVVHLMFLHLLIIFCFGLFSVWIFISILICFYLYFLIFFNFMIYDFYV